MIRLIFALLIAAPSAIAETRLLSIGGSVTEIVYALGAQGSLVGRDTTSSYPPEVTDLPDVGYMRALSPEGVLSVGPTLIVSEAGAGPQETIDVLASANIPFVEVPSGFTRHAVSEKIQVVADALNLSDKGEALVQSVDDQLAAVETELLALNLPARNVMFILSLRGGKVMASGRNTAADGIIRMAGARNVFSDFEGYKSVTDEAITLANPDVILMMTARGMPGNHDSDSAKVFALPALSTTDAAKHGNLIRMNGLLLLGFGPRIGEAVKTLHASLAELP